MGFYCIPSRIPGVSRVEPLFHFLFIVVMEAFNRLVKMAVEDGFLQLSGWGGDWHFSLFYACDTLLVGLVWTN